MIESSLSERAMKAEGLAETAESKRIAAEDALTSVRQQHLSVSSRLQESQTALQSAEAELIDYRISEKASVEKIRDMESRLALETAQRQSISVSLRELENRLKSDLQEAKEAADLAAKQADQKLSKAKIEIKELAERLVESEKLNKKGKLSKMRQNVSSVDVTSASTPCSTSTSESGSVASSSAGEDHSIKTSTRNPIPLTGPLPDILPSMIK